MNYDRLERAMWAVTQNTCVNLDLSQALTPFQTWHLSASNNGSMQLNVLCVLCCSVRSACRVLQELAFGSLPHSCTHTHT